jgi:hypothetical protein
VITAPESVSRYGSDLPNVLVEILPGRV